VREITVRESTIFAFFHFSRKRKMPKKKKAMGKGAVVSCLARYLHPSQTIDASFVNYHQKRRIFNLIVIDQVIEKVKKRQQECIVVQSDEVMDGDVHIRLHAVKRHFTVEIEGNPDEAFDPVVDEEVEPPGDNNQPLPAEVANLVNHLLETDCDNDPAPENDPNNNNNNNNSNECIYNEAWGHDGVCQRRKIGAVNKKPTILFPTSMVPSLFDIFELMLPKSFISEVMLPLMNERV
jgi:hypothetical protein